MSSVCGRTTNLGAPEHLKISRAAEYPRARTVTLWTRCSELQSPWQSSQHPGSKPKSAHKSHAGPWAALVNVFPDCKQFQPNCLSSTLKPEIFPLCAPIVGSVLHILMLHICQASHRVSCPPTSGAALQGDGSAAPPEIWSTTGTLWEFCEDQSCRLFFFARMCPK